MKTKQKLAEALLAANAPKEMVMKAAQGQYDDFESESATPIVDLVNDCHRYKSVHNKLDDIAERAKSGNFDATQEESEEWFNREGKKIMEELK